MGTSSLTLNNYVLTLNFLSIPSNAQLTACQDLRISYPPWHSSY